MTNLNWRTRVGFENNFVYILDKHAPKKKKFYGRIKKAIFIRTWWQIWINKPNCSTLRNLMLIVIPNHFEKIVNRNKIVIYKKILCCIKRINFIKTGRFILTFNKHFGSVTEPLNLFSWPEDLLLSSANERINTIITLFLHLPARCKNNK